MKKEATYTHVFEAARYTLYLQPCLTAVQIATHPLVELAIHKRAFLFLLFVLGAQGINGLICGLQKNTRNSRINDELQDDTGYRVPGTRVYRRVLECY